MDKETIHFKLKQQIETGISKFLVSSYLAKGILDLPNKATREKHADSSLVTSTSSEFYDEKQY